MRSPRNKEQVLEEKIRIHEKQINLRKGLPFLYGWKWYSWAREYFESTNRVCLLTAANQISKALDDDTKIPVPGGFKRMGDLKVGDIVFGQDGLQTKITSIPFKGSDECFKVTFDDGSWVIASQHHEWVCKTSKERFRKTYVNNREQSRKFKTKWDNPSLGKWTTKTTNEIISSGGYSPKAKSPWRRVSIPIADPIQVEQKEVLFDPYLVGLLLGDGGFSSKSVIITTADEQIAKYITECHGAKKNSKYGYRLNGYQGLLQYLNLMGLKSEHKFIPENYLNGTSQERIWLLRGLMDTDGTVNSKSATSFTTVSPGLRDGFIRLVTSLGGKAKYKTRKTYYLKNGKRIPCKDAYHVSFKILLCPFSLDRKAKRFYKTRYKHERVIYSIEPVGKKNCTCISVDNSSQTFLCTDQHIVTHNSSSQIRKCIDWATDQKKWPHLWSHKPTVFWYLYPSGPVATVEFEKKWSQFLPTNGFKDDPYYGWRHVIKNKEIHAIHFNSGVSIYFKTYSQDVMDLQSTTVDAIWCDEELPVEKYDELMVRLISTNGYFSMVFTATLGQEFWRLCMEPEPFEEELLPQAWKKIVSMYDCRTYEDGTPSHWTSEKIELAKARCKNDKEIARRIYGKFVKDDFGRKYEQFSVKDHLKHPYPIPKDWLIYAGVDIGSGGKENHPAAVCFVAVRPDYRMGRVFLGWRGDHIETTAGDVMNKFIELRESSGLSLTAQYYDWGSKDFGTIAQRIGEPFIKAEKSHDIGEEVINVLFKNNMLFIHDTDELQKLCSELISLRKETNKNKAKDDFCFASGTMVLTDRGNKPIEEIELGDLVYTRHGLRKVLATTKNEAEIFEYEFDDGNSIRCTENHRFWTVNHGFKSIGLLTQSDALLKTEWPKQSSLMASSLGAIPNQTTQPTESTSPPEDPTEKRGFRTFIKRFGSFTMARFQRALASTTKITTQTITGLKTYFAYLKESTHPTTLKKDSRKILRLFIKTYPSQEKQQRNGIAQRRGLDGTQKTLKNSGRLEITLSLNALCALVCSKQKTESHPLGFAQISASQSSGESQAKTIPVGNATSAQIHSQPIDTQKEKPALSPVHLRSSGKPCGSGFVYNITVEEHHEYFANGVLVSNCDALRYAVTSIPWDFTAITAAELNPAPKPEIKTNPLEQQILERREFVSSIKDSDEWNIEGEFEEWNSLYEG